MRLSVRRNVDLPHPDGPMKAVTRLARMRIVDVLQGALGSVVEVQTLDVDCERCIGRSGSRRWCRCGGRKGRLEKIHPQLRQRNPDAISVDFTNVKFV